jgi:hypothetical protein
VANSAITADVAVSAAAFAIATRKHLWDATTLGNGPTERFLEWKDWADAVLVALQALSATGGETALVTRTIQLADSQDEGSPWEEATKTIDIAIPTGEILLGVGLRVGDAWVSGDGDTTNVAVVLGINGGDTDRGAETVNLVGVSAGATVVWPAGVGLGEVVEAGTWQLLFTAAGAGDESLAHLTSGTVTATVLTVAL